MGRQKQLIVPLEESVLASLLPRHITKVDIIAYDAFGGCIYDH